MNFSRRHFLASSAALASAVWLREVQAASDKWQPRYIVGSSMFGETHVRDILPEVRKTGATAIDIWPKVHGAQREQLDEMGEEAFQKLLDEHQVTLGCITQYKLGPFGLQNEMRLAQRLGCRTIVTGGSGPRGLTGDDLKKAVQEFIEKLKPHLAVAEETGVTISVENHGNNLIESPDSMRYLMDLRPSENLGIAFAPYHLPQDPTLLAQLIKELGNRITMFYAWQHGMGSTKKLPKEQELLQMPGRGDLDFGPLMKALVEVNYGGWFEIFMHPVPRGVPILEPIGEVTAEINRSRAYLESLQ